MGRKWTDQEIEEFLDKMEGEWYKLDDQERQEIISSIIQDTITMCLTRVDLFDYAYENSKTFHLFAENLPIDVKKSIKRMQRASNASYGVSAARKGLYVFAGPIGWAALGAEAAITHNGRKKRKNFIKDFVESEWFEETFEMINQKSKC